MCGFAGFVNRDVGRVPEATLEGMGAAMLTGGRTIQVSGSRQTLVWV